MTAYSRENIKLAQAIFARKALRGILFLAMVSLLFFLPGVQADELPAHKKVLLIHSYHKGFQWTDSLGEGIMDTIREKMPQTDFVVEYMDTMRYFGPGYLFDLALIFKQKYRETSFDLIICTDDEALKLIRYYGPSLFPGVPVLFSSVRDRSLVNQFPKGIVTGSIRETPVLQSAELALSIHPEAENLLLVCDSSRACREDMEQFLSLGQKITREMEILTLSDVSLKQLEEKVNTLKGKTIVLVIRFLKDSQGKMILPEDLSRIFFRDHSLPVYTSSGPLIGEDGFLGGVALFPGDLGSETAGKAISILQGKKVESIPLSEYKPVTAFNYQTLQDLGISEKKLPKTVKMLNRPESYWEKNRDFILLNILVAAMVMIVVAYLLANIHRRKKAENELIREKEFMEQLFQNSPEGIVLLDRDDKVLRINREMCSMFRCKMEKAVGIPINELVAGGNDMIQEATELSRRTMNGETLEVETLRRRTDGTSFPVSLLGMPFEVEGERVVYGIYRDITEHKRSEERLNNRLYFEELISGISSRMVLEKDIHKVIKNSLAELCGFIGANRGYVGTFDREMKTVLFEDEWCSDNLEPLSEITAGKPVEALSWASEGLIQGGQIIVEDLEHSKGLHSREKEILHNIGTRSLILLPMYRGEVLSGVVGFHNPWEDQVWNNLDINMLKTYRDIVSEALQRDRSERQLHKNLESLKMTLEGTVAAVGKILEVRDPYTAGHQRRVAQLAVSIARELDLPDEQVKGIYYAALVHDIGKIHIPSEILSKPEKLSEIEESLVRHHCRYGWEILGHVEFPWPVSQIVLQHHEHLDGTGYPQGLKGDAILMEARILTVSDIVEAMSSDRPYRPAMGLDSALDNIQRYSGSRYDERVVKACLDLFRQKGFAFVRD